MHAIDPLITGFSDAPGGFARIYRRGTTTAATAYSDFEGAYPQTDHTLDGNGRCVRFVNELVDVKVYDVDGTQVVPTFTAGSNATAVEIIHAHVTGTDYATGASGTNKPTTLQRDLDSRYSSFGAKDSKVLVGGSERNLKDVLLTGIIDVTGPTYGAVGNGTTNVTTIVQAAITAADAAGGGFVFFPPGTYIVDYLTIPSNVTLLGCGPGKSIIQSSYASEVLLVATGALVCQGIKFKSTGKGLLRYTVAIPTGGVFTACALESSAAATAVAITGDVGGGVINLTTFLGCDFIRTGTGATQALLGIGNRIFGGTITYSSGNLFYDTAYNLLSGAYVEYQGSVTTSLVANGLSSAEIHFVSTAFAATGAGALQLASGYLSTETGCDFIINVTVTQAMKSSTTRDASAAVVSGSATSYAPNFNLYRSFYLTSTGASFQWGNPTVTSQLDGMRVTLWYKNTNGSAITPTFDTAYKGSAVSVASGSACGWTFEWHSGLGKWVQIGSTVAYSA